MLFARKNNKYNFKTKYYVCFLSCRSKHLTRLWPEANHWLASAFLFLLHYICSMYIFHRFGWVLVFTIVVLACTPKVSRAQIKTSFSFSGGHENQLKQLKELKKVNKKALKDVKAGKKLLAKQMQQLSDHAGASPELKRFAENYRGTKNKIGVSKNILDSLQALKKLPKHHPDSIVLYYPDNILINGQTNNLNKFNNISSNYTDKYDSLQLIGGGQNTDAEQDSLRRELYNEVELPEGLGELDEQSKAYLSEYQSYQQEWQKLNEMHDSLSVAQILIKTKQFDRIEEYLQQKALGKEGSELLAAQQGLESLNPGTDLPFDPNELNNTDVVEQVEETGLEYFENHADKLEAAHKSMADLKKKYSYVPNSNDLSTARKIKSLEGVPLKKRLAFGGTLQVHAGDPVRVDFSPLLGYKFDKRFSMGIGGTYRTSFGKDEAFIPSGDKSVFGGRVFSEYVVFKSFFAHAEYESLKSTVVTIAAKDTAVRKWSNGVLVGIGKSYAFSKGLMGNVTVLYNLTHDDNSPHRKPLVVRFGVMLK